MLLQTTWANADQGEDRAEDDPLRVADHEADLEGDVQALQHPDAAHEDHSRPSRLETIRITMLKAFRMELLPSDFAGERLPIFGVAPGDRMGDADSLGLISQA